MPSPTRSRPWLVLLIVEGRKGETRAAGFPDRVAPGAALSCAAASAGLRTPGAQWMRFALKDALSVTAQLLHLDRWRALTEAGSDGAHRGGRWEVSFPILHKGATQLRFSVPRSTAITVRRSSTDARWRWAERLPFNVATAVDPPPLPPVRQAEYDMR